VKKRAEGMISTLRISESLSLGICFFTLD